MTLRTRVADVLGPEVVRGLVVYDGVDHGETLTVEHLLTQTSGVPDYFEQPGDDGRSLAELVGVEDRAWSFEELVDRARQARSPFPPDLNGPAHYSDTNFQLLGRIVEVLEGADLVSVARRRVLGPLGLRDTWFVTPDRLDELDRVAPVRRGADVVSAPLMLTSFAADGGLVSTTADQLTFLQAFVGGELFPATALAEMTARWRRLPGFGPLRYGQGVMQFALPRWQSLGARVPPMIGHSGSFGSVLYHCPQTGTFVAGSVNQTQPRSLPYPLLARLALTAR